MLLWMQIHILNGASVTRIFKMNNIFYIHYTKSPRVKHDFKKKKQTRKFFFLLSSRSYLLKPKSYHFYQNMGKVKALENPMWYFINMMRLLKFERITFLVKSKTVEILREKNGLRSLDLFILWEKKKQNSEGLNLLLP